MPNLTKFRFPLGLLFILTAFTSVKLFAGPRTDKVSDTAAQIVQLHTNGKYIENPNGDIVRLTGVNVPSLEWTNTGENVFESIQVGVESWEADIIRLPLCQDRWFGKAAGQTDGGAQYREIVDSCVHEANDLGAYILLDLHWNDCNVWGQNIGQHEMPDDNSVLFWKSVAAIYANDPGVLFDLYNEPYGVSWSIWRNGGNVSEVYNGQTLNYHAPGLQDLLDTIRATGARNVVVAGGLNWGYDLSGVLNGYALSDSSGYGILYGSHIYPWKTNWDANAGNVSNYYPVFVGEFGANDPATDNTDPNAYTWVPEVLGYLDQHWMSWTAWCLHPTATPNLISDWNYTPTPWWGVFVKQALMNDRDNRYPLLSWDAADFNSPGSNGKQGFYVPAYASGSVERYNWMVGRTSYFVLRGDVALSPSAPVFAVVRDSIPMHDPLRNSNAISISFQVYFPPEIPPQALVNFFVSDGAGDSISVVDTLGYQLATGRWDTLTINGLDSLAEIGEFDPSKPAKVGVAILYPGSLDTTEYSGNIEFDNLLIAGISLPNQLLDGIRNTGPVAIASKYELYSNYPNPFNPSTTIRYDLPENSKVLVQVYDVLGRVVATLVNNERQSAGPHFVQFNASGLASGVYFLRLAASRANPSAGDSYIGTRKMLLLK